MRVTLTVAARVKPATWFAMGVWTIVPPVGAARSTVNASGAENAPCCPRASICRTWNAYALSAEVASAVGGATDGAVGRAGLREHAVQQDLPLVGLRRSSPVHENVGVAESVGFVPVIVGVLGAAGGVPSIVKVAISASAPPFSPALSV